MGHWYTQDGSPMHWVKAKAGHDRPTTLADARKLKLYPSVTEILNVADKPGLNNWRVEQAYLAALTLPKIEGESLDDFKKRAKKDAEQQTKDAMQTGSDIHAAIEALWNHEPPEKWREVAEVAQSEVIKGTGLREGFVAEKSFASDLGYGGMCDLYHPDGWVIDYKTKDFDESEMDKRMAWDEHAMQLSAYAHGLGIPDAKMMNVFVSRNNPGLVVTYCWPQKANEGNWFRRFELLLEYWQLVKGYTP